MTIDTPESEKSLYILQEDNIIRTGRLKYYDPLKMSDMFGEILSDLNVVNDTLPSSGSYLSGLPTGINSTVFTINLTSNVFNLPYALDFSTLSDGASLGRLESTTWYIASSSAINAPTLGVEALTNGNMETGNPPTGWSAVTSVLSGSTDIRTGSTGVQSLAITNSGTNYGYAQKSFTTTGCGIIFIDGWIRSGSVNNQMQIVGGSGITAAASTTAWGERKATYRITVTSGALVRIINSNNIASGSSLADDISVKYHTLKECFTLLQKSQVAPLLVKGGLSIPTGSWGGVVARLDNRDNPQNMILAFHDKTNIHLLTMLSGSWQPDAINTSASGTYLDKAHIEIRQSGSSTYSLWYNGEQIGTDQTITDSRLDSNEYHGLFGTYGGVSFTKFLCSNSVTNDYRFGAIGDSITSTFGSWFDLTCRDYLTGADNDNQAVSGAHILNDYSENLTNQVAAMSGDDVTKIIIAMGTNDNNSGSITAMQTMIETQVAILQSDHPNADIYYLNVLPRWTDSTGTTEVPKDNIRGAISAACSTLGITCWDTYTDPWINASDTSDGLHPNSAGQAKIATQVLARI